MARRILLLVTDLEIGGTPTVVRELAIRLKNLSGVYVEVACLAGGGPVVGQLKEGGIAVTALGAASVRDVGVIGRLVALIREHRIDTVFSFLIHANAAAAIAKVFARDVRFIQSIQTTQPWPRWHWKLQGGVQEAAERIVVPSESVAQCALEWADVPQDKIIVIPNAVEVGEFRKVRLQRVAGNQFAVGFIGRLDRVKRVPDLVRAMSILDERFVLHIWGVGGERGGIEGEIARLGLRGRVTMHGGIAKPQAALERIDLLVLPSEAEGFGLVLIEAMAARVPVVATEVAGICDVVKNEQTGLLVPVGNPEELAKGIRRVAEDEGMRLRLVEAAYEDVQSRFSWERVIQQYRELLNIENASS